MLNTLLVFMQNGESRIVLHNIYHIYRVTYALILLYKLNQSSILMKTTTGIKSTLFPMPDRNRFLKTGGALIMAIMLSFTYSVRAQTVLFTFDNIPQYTPFPVSTTVSGITAHLSGTGSSYSIQAANVLGFTPAGFSGNVIDPSSINLADLLISFDQKITDFSLMYSVQELACDTSATMQAKAYLKGNLVATTYTIASVPGTWPVDTLKCSNTLGIDSVVVHFYSHPSRCQDWGVVFMADNMKVIPFNPSGIENPATYIDKLIVPNPVTKSSAISFTLSKSENISIAAYDLTGRLVKNLFQGLLTTGEHQLYFDVTDDSFNNGIYFLNITEMNFTRSYKVVVVK